MVVGVDVDEQARLLVSLGQYPGSPRRLPPVRTLVLFVVELVGFAEYVSAVRKGALFSICFGRRDFHLIEKECGTKGHRGGGERERKRE